MGMSCRKYEDSEGYQAWLIAWLGVFQLQQGKGRQGSYDSARLQGGWEGVVVVVVVAMSHTGIVGLYSPRRVRICPGPLAILVVEGC